MRRQAKRDAALDGVQALKFLQSKQGKAASRFACRRTPRWRCDTFSQIGLRGFAAQHFPVGCLKFVHQGRMRQSLSIERNPFGDAYGAD